ncbi:SirB2 family protein [Noviluteimonas gilva]|uniref:Regulator SirB n=1 Tax=Noviluteimonas gilva TaxID=2682097 RepID=A0A7C9HP09_9GAMM|nr:SirB2 family protein [Lysobacter gilvus]MUV15775.1 hypothetical protein [Lysobacter gilvus]
MIEFYPQIKSFHVFIALLSGGLFALRGGFALAGARWPYAGPVRWTSWAIDTALLTAALMLLTVLPRAVFGNGWLAVKLTLIVLYIALGTIALKQARIQRLWGAMGYAAALLAFGAIYATARAHDPLGMVRWWLS